jgi:hypothetical protein
MADHEYPDAQLESSNSKPTVSAWEAEVRRVLLGQRESALAGSSGPAEYFEALQRRSDNEVLARTSFNEALRVRAAAAVRVVFDKSLGRRRLEGRRSQPRRRRTSRHADSEVRQPRPHGGRAIADVWPVPEARRRVRSSSSSPSRGLVRAWSTTTGGRRCASPVTSS